MYLHELAADDHGRSFAAVVNRKLGLGVVIDFDASLTGQHAILVGPFMTGSAGYVGNPNGVGDVTLAPMTVPEPGSLALATLASLGLLGIRRKH